VDDNGFELVVIAWLRVDGFWSFRPILGYLPRVASQLGVI